MMLKVKDKDSVRKLLDTGLFEQKEGAEAGQLEIPLLEAVLFAEKGTIREKPDDLLKKAKKLDPKAGEKLAVIRHLWERGSACRFSSDSWEFIRVYKKGFRPREDQTAYLLKFVEDGDVSLEGVKRDLKTAGDMRKTLIYAILEKDGTPRFLRLDRLAFE